MRCGLSSYEKELRPRKALTTMPSKNQQLYNDKQDEGKKEYPNTQIKVVLSYVRTVTPHPQREVLLTEVLRNDLVVARLLVRESKLVRSDLRQGADAVLSITAQPTQKNRQERRTRPRKGGTRVVRQGRNKSGVSMLPKKSKNLKKKIKIKIKSKRKRTRKSPLRKKERKGI